MYNIFIFILSLLSICSDSWAINKGETSDPNAVESRLKKAFSIYCDYCLGKSQEQCYQFLNSKANEISKDKFIEVMLYLCHLGEMQPSTEESGNPATTLKFQQPCKGFLKFSTDKMSVKKALMKNECERGNNVACQIHKEIKAPTR